MNRGNAFDGAIFSGGVYGLIYPEEDSFTGAINSRNKFDLQKSNGYILENQKQTFFGLQEEPKMDMEIDTKGMNCPLPILKAKKAMNQLEAGQTLKVLATDPGSVEDFGAFCRTGSHQLVDNSESEGVFTFIIKKAS